MHMLHLLPEQLVMPEHSTAVEGCIVFFYSDSGNKAHTIRMSMS